LYESLEVPLGIDFNWIFNADSILVNNSKLDCFVCSCISVEKSFKDSQDSFLGCFFTAIFLPHRVEDWPREIITESCWDWFGFEISAVEINGSKIGFSILNSSNNIPKIQRIHLVSVMVLQLSDVISIILRLIIDIIVIQIRLICHVLDESH